MTDDQGGIVRIVKRGDYFAASNRPFQDSRLSWAARGVMGYLLSRPDNWVVRNSDLIKQTEGAGRYRAGRDKVNRILAELKEHGYLRRTRHQDDEGKLYWVTSVYEDPRCNPDSPTYSPEAVNLLLGQDHPPHIGADAPPHTGAPEKANGTPSTAKPSMVTPEPYTAEPSTAEPFTAEPSTANPSIYKVLTVPSTDLQSTDQSKVGGDPAHTPEELALAEMVNTLRSVTGIDPYLKWEEMAGLGRTLLEAYTPEQVQRHYGRPDPESDAWNWYTHDWRGRRDPPETPGLGAIRATIGTAVRYEKVTGYNGSNGRRPGRQTQAQQALDDYATNYDAIRASLGLED